MYPTCVCSVVRNPTHSAHTQQGSKLPEGFWRRSHESSDLFYHVSGHLTYEEMMIVVKSVGQAY